MKQIGYAGAALAGLLLAGGALSQTPAGDPKRGEQVFKAQCITCHSTQPGATSPVGPHLYGVVGRKNAADDKFKYSPALRAADVVWTPENLDRWLEQPWNVAPGTPMALTVPDARNRADVIAYLVSIKPAAAAAPKP